MPSLIDTLVGHVLDTPPEAFTAKVREDGTNRLVDAIGCILSGARVDSNRPWLRLLSRWGGSGEASVLGSSLKLPVAHAAMLNSLQARSFDFEVCGPEGEGANAHKMVGHVGSTTEPTALAVGEYIGASGEELLAAVILGGDVAARIAVSDDFDFDKAFEVCGTANLFGAVAVAGRLLKLDHGQLRNAFGIALNAASGTFQSLYDGAATFKTPGALAAFNAVLSCELAREGFEGVDDALESRRGYFAMFPTEPHPENFAIELGEVFYVRGQHKLHPSCYGNHNSIESALDVRAQADFAPSDIESIVLEVAPSRIDHFLNKPFHSGSSQVASLFSTQYAVANTLVRGVPQLEHHLDANIHHPDVLDVAAKVRLVPVPRGAGVHTDNLVVTLKGGRRVEAGHDFPKGWGEDPMSVAQIDEKYWRNIAFFGGLDDGRAQSAFESLRHPESVENVAEIAADLSTAS